MSCGYCYVPRRKGYAITTFVNIDQIQRAIVRHAGRQGVKPTPNQCDPHAWVYDLGESSDLSVDAAVSDNVRDLVATFRELANAKASFATKLVNRDLLDYDPQGRTRVRFSLMPQGDATIVDVRTDRIADRIAAIDDFVEAGYEVRRRSWRARSSSSPTTTGCTTNLAWHPKAEELLWRPDLQEPKRSQTGGWNVRYKAAKKRRMVDDLVRRIEARLPYCRVRYAF